MKTNGSQPSVNTSVEGPTKPATSLYLFQMKCVSTRNWSAQNWLNKKPLSHLGSLLTIVWKVMYRHNVWLISIKYDWYQHTNGMSRPWAPKRRWQAVIEVKDRALMVLAVRQGEGVMKKQSCAPLLSTRFPCEQGNRAFKTILHPPHAFNLKVWCRKNQWRVLKELDFGISDSYVAPWLPKMCSCCARFVHAH